MAIVVEEGERKSNWLGIIGWVVFLGIIGAAAYYVFFVQPQLVTIPASGNLGTVAPIANIALHPEAVLQNPEFQTLNSNIVLPSPSGPAGVGRSNPFIAP